jgi:hypothetical protein
MDHFYHKGNFLQFRIAEGHYSEGQLASQGVKSEISA